MLGLYRRCLAFAASVVTTIALCGMPAQAVYNANISGVLQHVAIYADGDYIYFTTFNQPTSHPVCNPAYSSFLRRYPLIGEKCSMRD